MCNMHAVPVRKQRFRCPSLLSIEVTGRGPKTGAVLDGWKGQSSHGFGWLDVGRLGQHQSLRQRSVGEACTFESNFCWQRMQYNSRKKILCTVGLALQSFFWVEKRQIHCRLMTSMCLKIYMIYRKIDIFMDFWVYPIFFTTGVMETTTGVAIQKYLLPVRRQNSVTEWSVRWSDVHESTWMCVYGLLSIWYFVYVSLFLYSQRYFCV